jgi:hypothetical protein
VVMFLRSRNGIIAFSFDYIQCEQRSRLVLSWAVE